jgi:hypothetical protein
MAKAKKAEEPPNKHFETRVQMGLGEAIQRLTHVEILYARGLPASQALLDERALIVDALNKQYSLDLGFDCDSDVTPENEVPTNVEIFAKSVETACCRLVYDAKPQKKVRGSSRAK